MSKRLQVVFEDEELEEIRIVAERHRMTISEWVRHSLREARRLEPTRSVDDKLAALERAARHHFPTADIDDMLAEIARGHEGNADA